jgi:hypothetical protein
MPDSYAIKVKFNISDLDAEDEVASPYRPGHETAPFETNKIRRTKLEGYTTGHIENIKNQALFLSLDNEDGTDDRNIPISYQTFKALIRTPKAERDEAINAVVEAYDAAMTALDEEDTATAAAFGL